MISSICKPVSLNCFKHHFGFIAAQLQSIKNQGDFEKLLKSLVLTGNAQMDLYTGTLSPNEISQFVIHFLESENIFDPKKYIDWLATKKNNYFIVSLPDQSKWVLLKGKEKERFVHLHPARYSDHSIRISASSLKTAIASLAYAGIHQGNPLDKTLINHVRKTFLALPEVKSILPDSASAKLIQKFLKEIK
jgi:hypothetical protein